MSAWLMLTKPRASQCACRETGTLETTKLGKLGKLGNMSRRVVSKRQCTVHTPHYDHMMRDLLLSTQSLILPLLLWSRQQDKRSQRAFDDLNAYDSPLISQYPQRREINVISVYHMTPAHMPGSWGCNAQLEDMPRGMSFAPLTGNELNMAGLELRFHITPI